MESRSHALYAGLFVILLSIALALVAFWFSRDDTRLAPYVILTSGSASGLKVEAPVRYRGLDVGRVESIRIEPGPGGRIEIRVGIAEQTPITRGTYAQIGYLGVTGVAFVALNDDDRSPERLVASNGRPPSIRLKPSVLDSGEDLLAVMLEVGEGMKSLLATDAHKSLRRTLDNLERASGNAVLASERLLPGMREVPALMSETRGVLRDVSVSAASVREAAGSVREAAGTTRALVGSLNNVAAKIEDRLELVNRAAASIDEVGASARAVHSETLPRLNFLVDEIARETRSLDRVIQTISDEPRSLVFGAPPPRPGPGEPGFAREGAR